MTINNRPQLLKKFDGTSRDRKRLVQVFIGSITKKGKKVKAMQIFSIFLFNIRVRFHLSPIEFLERLVEIIRPKVFLISKKISGSTVRIPTPITLHQSYSIAVRWFLNSVSKRAGSAFPQLMFSELIDIYSNPSNVTLKKRDEYHRLAKLNRPFLRYNKF
jgi:ribosomal protein S7